MLAQRSNAQIDAIDIDKDSIAQTNENINNSKWKGRIKAYQIAIQEYQKSYKAKYDVIVSNPPFFNNSLKSPSFNKNLARHTDNLSFEELIIGVKNLLKPNGVFYLILPVTEAKIFKEKAIIHSLYNSKNLMIKPKAGKPTNRILQQFEFKKMQPHQISELILREENNKYTSDYIDLTRDFYLNL